MSLDELEEAWNHQPITPSDQPKVMDHIANMNLWFVPGMIVCGFAVLVALMTWGLTFQTILIAPEGAFGTIIRLPVIDVVTIVLSLVMIRQNLRLQRELQMLGQETYRCIEFLISQVNDEIRAVRRVSPIISSTLFVLLLLKEWFAPQSELIFVSRWDTLGLLACVLGLSWVLQSYQVRVYSVPRLNELKTLLQDFRAET